MDFFLYFFIYPIEWLMRHVLEGVFLVTENYGISIIILSIVVNVIILPLNYLADYLRDQSQKQLSSLQPKIDLISNSYKGQKKHYYLQTLYRVNNYHSLERIKASAGLLLQIPFFFAAFLFLGDYEPFIGHDFGIISDLSQPDRLLFGQNLLPILMAFASLSASYIHAKNMSNSDRYQLWGLSLVFLVLLYNESSGLLLYWTVNNLFSLIKTWIDNKYNSPQFKLIMANLLLTPYRIIRKNKAIVFIAKDIYIQAIFLFFGVIFIYQSIPIAASDVSMYSADYSEVVTTLFGYFVLSITIATILYFYLPKGIKINVLKLLTFAAISGVFYSFISPFYIEKLTSLSLPDFRLHEWVGIKLFNLSVIAVMLVVWFLVYKKIKKVLWIILFLSNVILSVNALSKGINPQAIGEKVIDNSSMSLEQANKFYSFSKNSNTIVIMLDMFQGNMFQDIIEKHPEIKQDFSGFVYYPNTLAHGSTTWSSMSALVGGQDFQVQSIEKLNNYQELLNITKSKFYVPKNISYLRNKLLADKYDSSYSVFNPSYADCDFLNSHDELMCTRSVILEEQLAEQRNKIVASIDIKSSTEVANFFTKFSFIMSMPHELKGRITRHIKGGPIINEYLYQISQYSQLKNMAEFANSDSEKSTFKFIDNKFTHVTWMANDNCQVVNQEFEGYQGLFNAGHCSVRILIDFFEKLKELGIYNNTKIIITSDHGMEGIVSQTKGMSIKDSKASALMLVKDFNESGDLQISTQLLSNMDSYGIALSGVSRNRETSLDQIKNPDVSRSLIYIKEVVPWTSYNITEAYEVKSNIFDIKNWRKLNKEEIEDLKQ